jgi:hypothetical protein
MRSGLVPMGFTSSSGLLRMKSAQWRGMRLASVMASAPASMAVSSVATSNSTCAGHGEGLGKVHRGRLLLLLRAQPAAACTGAQEHIMILGRTAPVPGALTL